MLQIPPWPEFGLHVVVKPIGPMCNLCCRYCFYLEKESLYGATESWRMTDETLEAFIRQYIEAQPATTKDINFTFQGGEPTLMGLDFFRRAVELEQKYLPPGKTASNSLQTNGILLDDQWCEFLRKNNFLVGLSLDGPEELHNAYRTDSLGHGSFDRVMRGLRCMQKHGVNFNAIACIHRRNGDHPVRVYRFLRDSGVQFMQFIPVVQPATDARPPLGQPEAWVTPESVLPQQFGRFLMGIFDEWAYHDVGRIEVLIGNLISPITSEFTQGELLNQGDGKRQGGHGRLVASHPLSPKSPGPGGDSAPARRLDRDSRPVPDPRAHRPRRRPSGNSKRRPKRVHVHEGQFPGLLRGRRLPV